MTSKDTQDFDEIARTAQEAAAERLKQARISAGFPSAMGAAKYFQWKTSTYASHENGSAAIRPFWAELYGQAFRVSPRWILSGIDEPSVMPATQPRMSSLARSPTTNINPQPAPKNPMLNRVGSVTTMNVYGWKRGEQNEILTDFSRITEAVSAPANLIGVEDAYAAVIADASMSPRVKPGDTIFVNPTKPARIGDLVIATDGKIGYLREFAGEDRGPYEEYAAAFVKDAEGHQMKLAIEKWAFHRVVGVWFD